MEFWNSLWNIITVFFWAFVFMAALFAFISVVLDLFRDKKLNGWWKALWIVLLVFLPLLTSLVYVIARGEGMAERSSREQKQAQDAAEKYIREVASSSLADEIAKAKALLDSGSITEDEYATLKARVLIA